jgi:plastocyanin
MRTVFIVLLALIMLGGGYYWYTMNNTSPESTMDDLEMNVEALPEGAMMEDGTIDDATMEDGTTDTMTGAVKEFTVTGSNFKFSPATMSVKKGDTVKITFINSGGMHDWVIDEFDARTSVIQDGAQETITFVADKTGSFEYYCSVGQHRANGMKGTLTVTE